MTAGIFLALLIIEGLVVWMVMDISSIARSLKEIKELLKARTSHENP